MKVTITIEGEVNVEDLQHIKTLFGSRVTSTKTDTPVKTIAKDELKPAVTPAKTEEAAATETVTIEKIRELSTEKGLTNKEGVKALLKKYGAAKMSALAQENYTAFYNELKDL